MPGIVTTLDQAIRDTSVNIALISYNGFTYSLYVRTSTWVEEIFGSAGPFPKGQIASAGERKVANWSATTRQAMAAIEGTAPGQSTVQSTALVQNAVVRLIWAAKTARARQDISLAQANAVIAAFNSAWVI